MIAVGLVACGDEAATVSSNGGASSGASFEFIDSAAGRSFELCNPQTSLEGACPEGLRCGSLREFGPESFRTLAPVCEFSGTPPYTLSVDIVPDPTGLQTVPPVNPVPVELVLRRAGEPWPESETLGAGRMSFLPAGTEGQVVTVEELPNDSDRLTVMLDPGDYTVEYTVNPRADDLTLYPGSAFRARLAVTTGGEVLVDFPVRPVDYTFTLDGQSDLPGFSFISVLNPGVSSTFVDVTDGPLAGRLWLPVGTYEVGFQAGDFGLRNDLPALTVSDSSAATRYAFDAQTTIFSGTVTLNGQPYPMSGPNSLGSGRIVIFRDDFSQTSIPISDTRPATFSQRVYAGDWEVVVDTVGTQIDGVPPMIVVVEDEHAVGSPLAIDLTTVDLTGEVSLRGETLPDATGPRFAVEFKSGRWSLQVDDLDLTGPGRFESTVFAGRYRVSVLGFFDELPGRYRVLDEWQASTTALDLNVDAQPVNLDFQVNGRTVPENTALGSARFSGPNGDAFSVALRNPTLRTALAEGQWLLEFENVLAESSLPLGRTTLSPITVAGSPVTETVDLEAIALRASVTLNGEPVAAAAAGTDRGALSVGANGFVYRVPLASTGPSEVEFLLIPGIYDVSTVCDVTQGCDPALGLPEFDFALQGLAVE